MLYRLTWQLIIGEEQHIALVIERISAGTENTHAAKSLSSAVLHKICNARDGRRSHQSPTAAGSYTNENFPAIVYGGRSFKVPDVSTKRSRDAGGVHQLQVPPVVKHQRTLNPIQVGGKRDLSRIVDCGFAVVSGT